MTTNKHNQPLDQSGHVIPVTETVRNALILMDRAMVSTDESQPIQFHIPLDDLVEFIMQLRTNDYASNVKLGIGIGRREVGAMVEAALEKVRNVEYLDDTLGEAVPVKDLQAIVTAAKGGE